MIMRFIFIGILGAVSVGHIHAYELDTHARLTNAAVARSLISDGKFLETMGIDLADKRLFGDRYYDVLGGVVKERSVSAIERERMGISVADELTLPAWLMRGAIREDDCVGHKDCLPNDDPFNGSRFPSAVFDNRPLHHFYDPIYDRGLTLGVPLGFKSPNWILGTNNAFTSQNIPETNRRNHFSVFDAREAMYRALTGRSSDGKELQPSETLTKQQDIRNAYWATTFRALGDIVHHVQDMAQPQHTRNDPHAGEQFDGKTETRGHKSVYESYINARATGRQFTTLEFSTLPTKISVTPPSLDTLLQAAYPIPKFTDYLSYYTTRHRQDNPLQRQGMADYSNRSFFTVGTNLNDFTYDLPSRILSDYTSVPLNQDWEGNTLPGNSSVSLLRGTVTDSFNPAGTQEALLTTHGVWDQFLVERGFFRSYTLNRYNYDSMANLLIPRAVAYSAGIINHFFRGKIDVEQDPANNGKLVVRNLGPEAMSGSFGIYYDAVDDKRYPLGAVNRNVAPGEITAGLALQPIPDDLPKAKTPGEYVMAFRGDMGEEKASAQTVGAVTGKVFYDPLQVSLQRVAFYVNLPNRFNPTQTYILGGSIARNFTLRNLIAQTTETFSLVVGGKTFPCIVFLSDSVFCNNSVSYPFEQFFIDPTGVHFASRVPQFSWSSSESPSGKITLFLGDAVVFNITYAAEALQDFAPVTFLRAFRVDTSGAVSITSGLVDN